MLDKANIEYEEKTNIQEMKALGFTKVPVLSIDENLLLFPDAVAWIQQKGAES
jgi:glutaredoxin